MAAVSITTLDPAIVLASRLRLGDIGWSMKRTRLTAGVETDAAGDLDAQVVAPAIRAHQQLRMDCCPVNRQIFRANPWII